MTEWSVQRLDPAELRAHGAEFRDIYLQVYQEPPYHESESDADDFIGHLDDQIDQPGFAFIAALSAAGEFIGFAYGLPFSAEQWWRNAGDEPDLTRGQAKFAVFELVVVAQWRRHGIATALITALLESRQEPFATLCANPTAPARAMYDAWGWRKVATTSPPKIGPLDVLVKALT
ncbi:GNAT family N-acetyltransferase [Dactylosporangium darangshiense]|uniref:N-acetyltransferase domain-containing protein n=1 Tax=Dactylosporangium darangshiense TaxID=579108 RepID=A0ABP8DHZ7_9ACTN